ncbi:hypothetical protein J2847_005793 [Azospirillum agricola]|uniref:hypothetical protein n=1 Tax=Azospirillum agricola TaxID=1720247 RepID=UPI001AE380A2|nr:hypothetical protein [Azospirillum agricola]MBP2232464.1 hypothetical protein [Azospirillum agricola]
MTDEELAELDELLALARQVHGVEKAWRKFRHIQAFARLDRDLRHREGGAVMHAHLIAADWPNYQGAADAVLSVMLERPEVVREILSETTAGEGRDKE